jgi:hypothetical protein
MMPRIAQIVAALLLCTCVGPGVLHAQEADTTTVDTTVTDTTAAAPDTTDRDTAAVTDAASDTTAVDTTRTATAAAPTRTDSLQAARRDSIAARQDSILAARRDSVAAFEDAAATAARSAAEEWLALTDAGKFDESWRAADSTLQNGISREEWIDQGRRVRGRLDSVRTRRFVRAQYRDSTGLLPGGRPVVLLKYRTEFDRGTTLEAVVTTKPDTTWKVAGYRVVVAPPKPDSMSADTTRTDTLP